MTTPACHAVPDPLELAPDDAAVSPVRRWVRALLDACGRVSRAVASRQGRDRPPHE